MMLSDDDQFDECSSEIDEAIAVPVAVPEKNAEDPHQTRCSTPSEPVVPVKKRSRRSRAPGIGMDTVATPTGKKIKINNVKLVSKSVVSGKKRGRRSRTPGIGMDTVATPTGKKIKINNVKPVSKNGQLLLIKKQDGWESTQPALDPAYMGVLKQWLGHVRALSPRSLYRTKRISGYTSCHKCAFFMKFSKNIDTDKFIRCQVVANYIDVGMQLLGASYLACIDGQSIPTFKIIQVNIGKTNNITFDIIFPTQTVTDMVYDYMFKFIRYGLSEKVTRFKSF